MDILDGLDNSHVVIEFKDRSVDVVREVDLVFHGPLLLYSTVKVMYQTEKIKKVQESMGTVLFYSGKLIYAITSMSIVITHNN